MENVQQGIRYEGLRRTRRTVNCVLYIAGLPNTRQRGNIIKIKCVEGR